MKIAIIFIYFKVDYYKSENCDFILTTVSGTV